MYNDSKKNMEKKTKKVLLMRHAKSSCSNPKLNDFDRPLNKRGERDAPRMGRYLKELTLTPDQIFSSPAERAKATALNVIKELELPESSIKWDKSLYFQGAGAYIEAVKKADDASDIVMTVGHNPMTEDVVYALSDNTSNKAIKTATIACFEFETNSWRDIQVSAKALKWIVGPKDLK